MTCRVLAKARFQSLSRIGFCQRFDGTKLNLDYIRPEQNAAAEVLLHAGVCPAVPKWESVSKLYTLCVFSDSSVKNQQVKPLVSCDIE
jgi:hypothetical protein